MTADDLTRLRDEIDNVLFEHRFGPATHTSSGTPLPDRCECWKFKGGENAHRAHVASVLASSPTVAALIDRVERAERERDLLQTEVNTWIENDQISFARATRLDEEITALRAAVVELHKPKGGHNPECDCGIPPLEGQRCAAGCNGLWPCATVTLFTEGADDGQ